MIYGYVSLSKVDEHPSEIYDTLNRHVVIHVIVCDKVSVDIFVDMELIITHQIFRPSRKFVYQSIYYMFQSEKRNNKTRNNLNSMSNHSPIITVTFKKMD